jgi:HSP20 family protein
MAGRSAADAGHPAMKLPQKGVVMNLTRWSPFTKWDPFKEMEELTNRLAPWLGAEGRLGAHQNEMMTVTQWVPLVDITEDEKEYLIKTELPEVKKEDVKVSVENGRLSISGERKFEKEEKEKDRKYHRIERSYGSFLRSFTLPDIAKADQVMAEFKDGVLLVHVPKAAKAAAKSVDVKIQ